MARKGNLSSKIRTHRTMRIFKSSTSNKIKQKQQQQQKVKKAKHPKKNLIKGLSTRPLNLLKRHRISAASSRHQRRKRKKKRMDDRLNVMMASSSSQSLHTSSTSVTDINPDPQNLKGRNPLPNGDVNVINGIEDAAYAENKVSPVRR